MTWLLVAVACLANFADVGDVRFATWGQPSRTRIATKVRAVRDQERPPPRRRGQNSSKDAEARKLTVDLKEAQSADKFLNILGKAVNGPIFNDFHASCAYHSLATWKRRGKLAKAATYLQLPKLSARVREMIGEGQLRARGLANVLWSLAYLVDDFTEVVDIVPSIVAQVPVKAEDMKPQELSNILWAAAKTKDDAPDVIDIVPSIVAKIQVKAKEMDPQGLSNVLWAAAYLKDDAPDVIDIVPSIVAQIPGKAKDMKPQDVSNSLWAAAKLKDDAPDVINIVPSIVAKIPVKAKDMIPQHLSNVLWAAANLKDDAPDVIDIVPSIVAEIPGKANDMIPQQLSNVLWAAANLKDDAPDVIDIVPSIVVEIPGKAKDMDPQGLSNILWAAANLKDDAPDVIDIVPSIVAQIQVKAKDMVPQALSNSLWAAANLKDDAPDVIDIVPSIVAQIPGKAKDMKPQEVSNTLVALVPLQDLVPGVKAFLADETASTQAFVQFAASWMVKLIPRLKGPDLLLAVPSVVWACAKLEVQNQDLLAAVAKRFGSQKRISRLSAWGLCSLYGSYQMLDPTGRFIDFSEMLKKELTKRGFSESDVGWSLEGPLEWVRTNK